MKRLIVWLMLLCCLCSSAFAAELPPLEGNNDPISFTMFIRDQSVAPAESNPVIQRIRELTGVTLNMDFLVGDLDWNVGIMIASGKYPDAIFAESPRFINAGAFIPLEDLIEEHCPNLYEYYQPWWESMRAEDGHIYVLDIYGLQRYTSNVLENSMAGFWIQKRVLEWGGYVIPRTLDEYFALLEGYLAEHPETNGKENAGFSVLCDGWLDFCLRNPPQHLMGAGNDGNVFVDPETLEVSLYQNSEAARVYYQKLNEEYHKGVVYAPSLIQSNEQYLDMMAEGRILGMFDQGWCFSSAVRQLEANGMYDCTYISLPITLEGYTDAYLDAPSTAFTGNNGVGITVSCEDPLRLLKFFDWIIREDVQTYLYWGEEGVDYTVNEEGRYVLTEERRAINQDEALLRDITGKVLADYCPKRQGLYTPGGNACEPIEQPEEFRAMLSEYDRNFLDAYGFQCYADFLSPPVERPAYYPVWSMNIPDNTTAAVAQNQLVELCRRYFPRMILCNEGDFDTLWQEFSTEMEQLDIQPYLDEVQRQVYLRMERGSNAQ